MLLSPPRSTLTDTPFPYTTLCRSRNTAIETSMYGYTGYSPRVTLYAFKEGKQSQVATRRKIGNYANLSLDCTPTGEAMAAVADLLDDVAHKRRILMVMTDGIADNPKLCEDVITVLEARGEIGRAHV